MSITSIRTRFWSTLWDVGDWISTSNRQCSAPSIASANTPIFKFMARNFTGVDLECDMRVFAKQQYTLMRATLCRMKVSLLLSRCDWEQLRAQSATPSRKRTKKRTRKGESRKMEE